MGPTNGKHTNRDNADKYFLLDQRYKVTELIKNLTQMKDFIQFCADYYGHPPPQPRFHAKSRIDQECTEEHRPEYSENIMIKTKSAHLICVVAHLQKRINVS